MEQKRLVLELRQVEERISKRDERIMQELHDIRKSWPLRSIGSETLSR